jgi:hypothetical protein|tara:strand:- start:124 stop:285 length:162 start_codon:yes stop_codon:yes gene_type:complete
MINKGDWVIYDGGRKKCFGIHVNGNIIIKMNNTLVQVYKEKIKVIAQGLGEAK